MASVDLELQVAIYARLVADAGVSAIADGRVFDHVPADASFPFVHLGESQEITEDVSCVAAKSVYLTLHGWSREVGFPEVKRLADAVEDALHLAPLVLNSWRLISINHRETRVFRDRDGLSSHAVIDFAAFVERT